MHVAKSSLPHCTGPESVRKLERWQRSTIIVQDWPDGGSSPPPGGRVLPICSGAGLGGNGPGRSGPNGFLAQVWMNGGTPPGRGAKGRFPPGGGQEGWLITWCAWPAKRSECGS